LLSKGTKMLPNPQLMLPLSGHIYPEANILKQIPSKPGCFCIVNDVRIMG